MIPRTKYLRISWHEFTRSCDVVDLNGIACVEDIALTSYTYFDMNGEFVTNSIDKLGRKIGTIYRLKKGYKIAPWYANVELEVGIYG